MTVNARATHSSQPPTAAHRLDIIQRLPHELQLRVYDNLAYLDAIHLSQVNHVFHTTINQQEWPTTQESAFVEAAQQWRRYNLFHQTTRGYHRRVIREHTAVDEASNGFACFHCFRVLLQTRFSASQTERSKGKSDDSKTRVCLDCGTHKSICKPGGVVVVTRKDTGTADYYEQQTELFLCGECESFQAFSYLGECAPCKSEHGAHEDLPINTQGRVLLACSVCQAASSVAAGVALV